jgi:hypothetical protein
MGKQENPVKEKTEIEIELSETIAYSRRGERFKTFCSECQATVEVATTHAAAIVTHMTEREVYRLVETGEIHFTETDRVLVCIDSITGYQKSKEILEK